jgi:hypothetical protein
MSTVFTAPLVANGTFNPTAGYAEFELGEAHNTEWPSLFEAENNEQWEEASAEELDAVRLVSGNGTIYRDGNGGFFAAWEA